MSAVFKRIYTLERINCDSSVFDSLYLKSFLCHGCVSVLTNPVNPEKQIKDGYHHQQLICCLSKCSVSQLEVKVSIKNDVCVWKGTVYKWYLVLNAYFMPCFRNFWDCIVSPSKTDLHSQNSLSSYSPPARGAQSHDWSEWRLQQGSPRLRLACAECKVKKNLALFNCGSYLVSVFNILKGNSRFFIMNQVENQNIRQTETNWTGSPLNLPIFIVSPFPRALLLWTLYTEPVLIINNW